MTATKDPASGTKHFVLDTSVLLHDPEAMFVFHEHEVVIPFKVIEELDKLKREGGDIGRNARECVRHLDRLRNAGRLVEGVKWGPIADALGIPRPEKTGVIRVDVTHLERPPVLREETPDNAIIAVAWGLMKEGQRAVFVSKDLNARIKSDALGIRTEDFEAQKVDAERLYRGYVELDVPRDVIDRLYKERALELTALDGAAMRNGGPPLSERALFPNQFVVLHALGEGGQSGLARRARNEDRLVPVSPVRKPVYGVLARSVQQVMALDLLMDDDVSMVTLLGSAGTGKTLLAVAAGMMKVFNDRAYDKLLVARPIMPMGRDIGFLPGTKDEKLAAWMQPIFDNLTYLLSTRGAPQQGADSRTAEQRINKMIADGQLVLEPLTYIRGRSIPHQFLIVDETQNLTPHEVKTIISRVGEGTKVVLTGDIGQIDNPYLDSASNGLSYAVEKLKGQSMVGHVMLVKSERSNLASIAASLL